MHEPINYNLFTKLPVQVLSKADQMSPVLKVFTPNKGIVFIELKEIDKGMFRRATEVSKPSQAVLNELYKLEDEATAYFFNQWLKHDDKSTTNNKDILSMIYRYLKVDGIRVKAIDYIHEQSKECLAVILTSIVSKLEHETSETSPRS